MFFEDICNLTCHSKLSKIHKYCTIIIIVSESDILGPNGNLSDIKNLVSFERWFFEDSSYKYRITIFLLFMPISPLWNTCLKHHIILIDNFTKIWYIHIICKKMSLKSFLQFSWSGKSPLNYLRRHLSIWTKRHTSGHIWQKRNLILFILYMYLIKKCPSCWITRVMCIKWTWSSIRM